MLCALILAGSLSYAFVRRYEKCPDDLPVPVTTDPPVTVSPPVIVEPAQAAAVDTPIERVQIVDTESVERIAKLEAENARLRAELGSVRFASALASSASKPTTLVEVMNLMERSDLIENEELRELFMREVRQDVALDLLRAEPAFRASLHRAYSDATPEWRQFEWPARRDQLLNDFIRRLAEAGLSGKAIELYRASIADYL